MIPAFLADLKCLYLAKEDHSRTGCACLAVLEAKDLLSAAKDFLAAGYHLEDVSGLMAADGAVAVYHFDLFDAPARVTVLVIEPYGSDGSASFPSIASVYQGAEWHERETRDFYGFGFDGNPNFVPLLLADDMAHVHPLYKEEAARAPLATIFSAPERKREVLQCANGFTLLDAPIQEEPPVTPQPAPQPEVKAEPAAAKAEPVAAEKTASPAEASPSKKKTVTPTSGTAGGQAPKKEKGDA